MKTLATAAMILVVAAPLVASGEDDLTSLSYISYLERYATIQPVNNDESIEATINMPLVVGDRVDTAREARMEVILADGGIMWLDQYTSVSLDAVAFSRDLGGERTVLYLIDGSIMLQVPEHVLSAEPLRIDSSGATVYINQPGTYRIEVLRSGGLRVEVWEGLAEAATTAGGVLIQPSTAAEVRSGEISGVEPHLTWGDDFARWVEQRRLTYESESSEFVDERYARESGILDSYGTWVYVDATQSWGWQPAVDPGWQPYTAGRWYWTATGWSWVSYEPWGWLPYHYGSWSFSAGFGWTWGWGSVWSPAWVSWCWWPGYVSWCPWGYYNSWCWGRYPGWGWGGYPPGHPVPPIAGQPRPPRGNVIPPRDGVSPGEAGRRQTPDPSVRAASEAGGASRRVTPGGDGNLRAASAGRAGADFTGHVRVASMDRAGWNVVAAEDFASEHLPRVVQPGSRVMPNQGDATGVVVTGPLTTRSPASANTVDEISRTFSDVGARTDRDITRVMARDNSLQSEDISRLVQPTSLSTLGRSSAQSVVAGRSDATTPVTIQCRRRARAGAHDDQPIALRQSVHFAGGFEPVRRAQLLPTRPRRQWRKSGSAGSTGSGAGSGTSGTAAAPAIRSIPAPVNTAGTAAGRRRISLCCLPAAEGSRRPAVHRRFRRPETRPPFRLPGVHHPFRVLGVRPPPSCDSRLRPGLALVARARFRVRRDRSSSPAPRQRGRAGAWGRVPRTRRPRPFGEARRPGDHLRRRPERPSSGSSTRSSGASSSGASRPSSGSSSAIEVLDIIGEYPPALTMCSRPSEVATAALGRPFSFWGLGARGVERSTRSASTQAQASRAPDHVHGSSDRIR